MALGVISIDASMRAEMLPEVPSLKPAAVIARHCATIAARKLFSLVPNFASPGALAPRPGVAPRRRYTRP